jgi:DNA-binding beta-propeller fold protein YncE
VSVINGHTNKVITTVAGVDDPIVGIAVDPRTSLAYVTNFSDNTLSVLACRGEDDTCGDE